MSHLTTWYDTELPNEMIELTQKEIRALLTFMECRDVEEWSDVLDLPELLTLHSKLTSAQTY